MRLVKLSDLSEEERQKVLEEQEARINRNKQASEQIRINANNKFNEYTAKNGSYDANKHYTTIGDLKNVYKNTSSYNSIKTSTNEVYKNNKSSIWEQVKNIASGLRKNIQNTGLGVSNGINYFRQQLERNTRNNSFNNALNMNNDFLQKQLNKNANDEKTKIMLEQNNKYINNIKNEQNSYQNKLKEKINKNNEKISENAESINNPILKKTAELAPSIGQMIPGFIPGAGIVYMTGSASGQYYEDAKQRGMNDEEAQKYSGIMGLMEGATEMIGIENLSKAGRGVKALVKGTGKEVAKQGTKEIAKSSLKSVLKDYGIGIVDNIMQEAIIDPIQELTAQIIGGKDKAQWEDIGQRMLQDGINGGLVSAILGGANLGIQSCTGVVEKLHSNQKITNQEIQNAVKDASQKLDTSKMMMDSVEQQVNKYKDYYTGKKLDSNSQNVLNKAQDIINNNQNLQSQSTQNEQTQFIQQINKQQNKRTYNENIGQNVENNNKTLYNNIALGEIKNVPTEEVFKFKTDGGYRDNQQMESLRKDIQENGIKNPIELFKNKDGSIEIENGNHRLQIAKELGIEEVPVKFVESWDNIGIKNTDNDRVKKWEDIYNESNRNRTEINKFNERTKLFKRSMDDNRNQLGDRRTATTNDRLSDRVQTYDDRTSSNSTFEKNNQGLEKSSPFNLPTKEDVKTKSNLPTKENTNTKGERINWNEIEPYRTSEEIIKDNKISDLDAIREETKKINTPEIDEVEKLQNKLRENSVENSPTIDYIKAKRSKEKVSIKEIKDTLAQKFVNKGHYIDKLANKTENKNLTYLYDRTMNTFNESQISIGDYQINSKGEVVGKSIIDIFQPAQDMKLSKEFDDYLLNKHNISRYAHEKGIFGKEISATDSQNIINSYEKKYPQFKEWAQEVSKYNDNNIKDLVDNGLVSEVTYKRLKEMYGDYVPTFRDITDNISQYEDDRVGGNTLKRATESNLDILSVKESMAEQTLAIKKAIRMNNLGKELYRTLGKDSTITTGIDFDAVAMQTIAGNVIDSEGKGKNTFTIFQDGEMTQFKISDELYSAFAKDTLQNKVNNSKTAKALLTPVEKMSKAQRELLTTYSVGFALNNPIKDFQDALFNTKYSGGRFIKNWTKALYNIGTDGTWYQNYKNNGGTANTYFDYDKGILPTKTKNPIKKFANNIKNVNEIFEQAPRLAEYISTIETGGSIDEALYNAAEITTNFKRGGDITKAVNKYGVNFLNASVQGLDKTYRNISGQNGWKGYASLVTKATLYQIAPAIINGLLLGNDDDYEDLPEYTKDNYFLFKMGEGKFFRIPKGRVSSVVGGIARRALETTQGKEVDWNSLVDTTINQMAPNNPITDNVLAPIIQAKNNKSWYGGDIVNTRLQSLPTAEQYDESTDTISKWLGEKLNISPKKINYVLDQYSGGIGDVLLPIMTPQAENNILEDKFTTDSVMKNKYVSEYYSKTEELEKAKNSSNATDEDILKYKYFTDSSSDLADLYKQKRSIQNSDLSNKEKKEQVRKIQKQINEIVENKLNTVENTSISENTAIINDTKYYKYHGEWEKLSEEEIEKNKNISLKSYADYKNKVYNQTETKKKTGELKENQQLKDKDKIKILLNSNYTETEKENLYKNYIGTNDKKIILVDKLGLPLNQYLEYKTQDFENDKDTNGETISGTKKQKVYKYLNSINDKKLSQNYKKIICKIEGINSYDKEIVDFVRNNNKLAAKEQKEILKIIGYKVDNNGNVKSTTILPITKNIK